MPKLKRNNATTEHKIWVRAASLSLPRALFICSHRIKPQSTQTHQDSAALKGQLWSCKNTLFGGSSRLLRGMALRQLSIFVSGYLTAHSQLQDAQVMFGAHFPTCGIITWSFSHSLLVPAALCSLDKFREVKFLKLDCSGKRYKTLKRCKIAPTELLVSYTRCCWRFH